MNKNPKSNYTLDTDLDFLTQLDVSDDTNQIWIMITHDYFSSNDEYGHSMIIECLKTINSLDNKHIHLIICGSAVKLLSDSLASELITGITDSSELYIPDSSIRRYNIGDESLSMHYNSLSDSNLFRLIFDNHPVLIS